MSFRVAADAFLYFCTVERQLSENTLAAYAADLADFREWLPPGMPLSEISAATLSSYLEWMVTERRLATATIRRRLACLRAFFRRLAELNEAEDPFVGWRIQLPRRKRLPRALSGGEVASLLAMLRPAVDSDGTLRLAVRLMVSTGLRVGELCKLRLEDVPPDGSSLRVHGKGSRDRIAYVADIELQGDLRQFMRARRRDGGTAALFVNRRGLAMKPQSLRARLRHLADRAGLNRRITPHMLRHTAATLLIEKGVDIRFVQRLLGHSSIATTEIYTHVSDEALRTTLARADILAALSESCAQASRRAAPEDGSTRAG